MMESGEAQTNEFYGRAERRIGWLTLGLGLVAAVGVLLRVSPVAGAGVAAGAILAWLNYRWLEQTVDALVRVSTAPFGADRPRVSKWIYVKFFARYALIAVVLYAMVTRFSVPILSVLGGLASLGAGAMAEAIYEIFLGFK